jgi:DNA-binding beta-propeller fold protein YncE
MRFAGGSLVSAWLSFIMVTPALAQSSALALEHHAYIGARESQVARPRHYDAQDSNINSPKSVRFSADGSKIYVNSLEGGRTVVYSWPRDKHQKPERLKVIHHNFTDAHAQLFQNESTVFNYPYVQPAPGGRPNVFMGKPVESQLSHKGRYLWIPYYRRSWDPLAQSPSAVAIIDTRSDEIVRVMPTGPIPKYVAASEDGRYVAITHWGDNTIGIIDTSSGNPATFRYVSHLIVERQMSQQNLSNPNRDVSCGFCLRGTVFSPDGQHLIVARMGGGGLAGFHVPTARYLGTIDGVKATPRHLALSPDGRHLYISSNVSGYVSKTLMSDVVELLQTSGGRRVQGLRLQETFVGTGARTLEVSSDGRLVFAALNSPSQLVALDADSMQIVTKLPVDNFAVGLAIAPDTSAVVVTMQGRSGQGGGHAVNIVRVQLGDYYRTPLRRQ